MNEESVDRLTIQLLEWARLKYEDEDCMMGEIVAALTTVALVLMDDDKGAERELTRDEIAQLD